MQTPLEGLPFQFALYGSTLSASDYQTIMLSSLLISLIASCAFGLLTRFQRPGKRSPWVSDEGISCRVSAKPFSFGPGWQIL
ncbi:hypothetical protein WDV93_01720 [Pantoea ananatis]